MKRRGGKQSGQKSSSSNTRTTRSASKKAQGVIDRLRPSIIRKKPEPKTEEEKEEALNATEILKEYGVTVYDEEAKTFGHTLYVHKFPAASLSTQVMLPELATNPSEDLKTLDPSQWKFSRDGLIRGQHPDKEFRQKFKESKGFQADQAILVVPYLSHEEELEFEKDPMEFKKTKLCNPDWHDEDRKYWVLDGAHRLNLSIEFKYDMYAQIMSPDISYEHAVFMAVNRNEGVTHSSNTTRFLDKVRRIGGWCDDGMNAKDICLYAPGWTTKPLVSQYKQCYKAIYKNADARSIVPIVEDDIQRAPEECMYSSLSFYLSKVFKYIEANTSTFHLGDFFKEVNAYKNIDGLKERAKNLGLKPTWGSNNQIVFQWLYLMRHWLLDEVKKKNVKNRAKMQELKIPTEVLKKHEDAVKSGKHDHFLVQQYQSCVKNQAGEKGEKDFTKTGGISVETFSDNFWPNISRNFFQNHYKDVTKKIANKQKNQMAEAFQPIPETYLGTADATKPEEWKKVLEEGLQMLPSTVVNRNPRVVVLTSPPWGVLMKNQIPGVKSGMETDTDDVALTEVEIGHFASAMKTTLSDYNATVILHLPPQLYGDYKKIFELNGWQSARVPITIVTTGFRKSTWSAESLSNNVDSFYIFHKRNARMWKSYDDCHERFPKANLKCLALGGIAIKDNMVHTYTNKSEYTVF